MGEIYRIGQRDGSAPISEIDERLTGEFGRAFDQLRARYPDARVDYRGIASIVHVAYDDQYDQRDDDYFRSNPDLTFSKISSEEGARMEAGFPATAAQTGSLDADRVTGAELFDVWYDAFSWRLENLDAPGAADEPAMDPEPQPVSMDGVARPPQGGDPANP